MHSIISDIKMSAIFYWFKVLESSNIKLNIIDNRATPKYLSWSLRWIVMLLEME